MLVEELVVGSAAILFSEGEDREREYEKRLYLVGRVELFRHGRKISGQENVIVLLRFATSESPISSSLPSLQSTRRKKEESVPS